MRAEAQRAILYVLNVGRKGDASEKGVYPSYLLYLERANALGGTLKANAQCIVFSNKFQNPGTCADNH